MALLAGPKLLRLASGRVAGSTRTAPGAGPTRDLYAAEVGFLVNAAAKSLAFVLFAAALQPVRLADVWLLVGAFNAANTLGTVGITPAGLGVREGAMAALLADRYGLGDGATLAVAARRVGHRLRAALARGRQPPCVPRRCRPGARGVPDVSGSPRFARATPAERRWLVLLTAAFICAGAAFAVMTPMFENPDEATHLDMARHYSRHPFDQAGPALRQSQAVRGAFGATGLFDTPTGRPWPGSRRLVPTTSPSTATAATRRRRAARSPARTTSSSTRPRGTSPRRRSCGR